jgi:hypothetical protein
MKRAEARRRCHDTPRPDHALPAVPCPIFKPGGDHRGIGTRRYLRGGQIPRLGRRTAVSLGPACDPAKRAACRPLACVPRGERRVQGWAFGGCDCYVSSGTHGILNPPPIAGGQDAHPTRAWSLDPYVRHGDRTLHPDPRTLTRTPGQAPSISLRGWRRRPARSGRGCPASS